VKNKFVFDTNSLVSALLLPLSISRRALDRAAENGDLMFSIETLAELKEVLIRSKFDKYVLLINRLDFINKLQAEGTLIVTLSNFTVCRDVKDNKFLNLAVDSRATCIVSGDNDLLILSSFHNIPIITPANFISFPI
jgi:putative PIN family toxin of toxin-antitoxin system